MNQYILLDELRAYLATLGRESAEVAVQATCTPVEDSEDALGQYEILTFCEAEQQTLDEVDSWAMGHAITGSLIVPTLPDGILA
ncbi:MAG: hypothetical protein ACI3U8_02675 [Candidatus Onthomonas sp.]